MDIIYLGQSSFKIKGKQTSVVTDPYGAVVGFKFPKTDGDIVSISHSHPDHNALDQVSGDPFVISGPGEYEVKGVKVTGVDSFHDNKLGKERGKNTIFNFRVDGVSICHLGDLGQDELSSNQIDELGKVDILLVPVGGGYTIDAQAATKIISVLEPQIVIPMHFGSSGGLKMDPVENFLKEMSKENAEKESKLSITKEKLPSELQVVVLERKV